MIRYVFPGIAVALGAYLILKPEAYKNEMERLGHLFGEWPPWMLRLLGVFLVVFAAGITYLFLASK